MLVTYFSNYKCYGGYYVATNYIVRPCAVLSYLFYFLLWREIKTKLRNAITDVQKKRNLQRGYLHLCSFLQSNKEIFQTLIKSDSI